MKTARWLFNQSSLPYSATSCPICHINLVLASSACCRGAAAYDSEEGKIRRFKKQISHFPALRVWEFPIEDQKRFSQWGLLVFVCSMDHLMFSSIEMYQHFGLFMCYFLTIEIYIYIFFFYFFHNHRRHRRPPQLTAVQGAALIFSWVEDIFSSLLSSPPSCAV